jgi:hypothetical protein
VRFYRFFNTPQHELSEGEIFLYEIQKVLVVYHQRKLFLVDEIEISFHVAITDMKSGQQTL